MTSTRTCFACSLGLALLLGGQRSQAEDKPQFYFEVQGVRLDKGIDAKLADQARQILQRELAKHPKIVTDLGAPAPKGKELQEQLKARGLAGYGVILRVTKATHTLEPPPPGKAYKVLMVEVAVAIDAEKIPSGQLALAGEGMAQVGTETSRFTPKERDQLLGEALGEAIGQAVGKSVEKLGEQEQKPAKRKRARRR